MLRMKSSFGIVVLTDERRRHIEFFHPEVKRHVQKLNDILHDPDSVSYSRHDGEVRILYKYFQRSRRYLAVVIKLGKQNFVLTAYFTKRIK
jgi:hypothetical protein